METEGAECNGSVKLEKSPSDGLITYKRRRDDESSTDATKVLERPGRNGDIGWKHCVKVGADLMCNWCGYQTCGGITKIKYHLAGGFQVWKCPKVPAAVSKSIKEARLIKMRMRREKRLAQNCRSDGKEMNNPCKVDLVYADSTKCDQKIQVECIGIFNLKADKQFENTKTATESSKSADHCSGMPTQLPKTDMNKIQVESAGIFNSKAAKQFGNTKTAAKSSESADHCSGIASQLPKIDMTKIQVESAGIFNPKADMQFENTKTATKSSKSADHCSGTASQLPKTDMTKVESAGIFNLKADKQFENTKTATKSSKSADHRLRTASQLPKTDMIKVLERPGRNGDIGWKHCLKVGADLMCNWCGYQTCGGITKIKYHLAGGFQVWKCPKVPAAVSKSIKEAQLIKMRMRRKKRLAQNCRSDGKEMNNPWKVDLVYADSTKCNQKIQVESAGIFNLKADKQFENTKTATESSKSADHCSGMPTQLPKTDMNKIQVESAGIFNSKGAKQFGNTKTAAKSSESADHCSGIASQLPKIDMTKIQVESAGIFNPKADMQFENTKTATKSSKSADHCSGTASQLPKTDMTKVESAGIFNLKADKQFENTKTATKSSKSADHRLRTASQLPKTDMIKVLERPGRNGDIGWKHCLKVGADLMCNWCGYQTCGGITKIKYHLAGGFQVWKCPKVPAAVSKSIKEAQLIKMRMRRKKRLAQNCRSDGKEMNNPWKVDLVYADSTKCNQKIQVESAGIFNLKADKQFENAKTATESSKSADHCSGRPTQLPKTDMNKIQVESAGIFNSKGAKQFGNTKTAAKSLESADHCSGIASQLPKIDMTKIQVESAGIFNPKADMQFENTKTATKSLKSADHCSGTASQLPKTDMTKIQVESAGIFNLKADKQFENTKTATKSSKSADHRLRTASQLPKTDMIKVLERPGRNGDIGWKHCVKVGADLMCNWCGYQTCGGITKIKYHLAGGFQVWKCPKVPAAVSKSIKEAQLIKMRMRREKRLAQNCRSDGKEMNNPCKVDIVYADSMKCEKKIQVESAGIFNPKADKQFENTKAATISSKSADQCPGTASQLPKIDMTKLKIIGPAETVSYTDSHPERHDRICRCWRSAIECQLKLSYVTPGQGIWNILHAALSFDHSQLSHKLMMNDVIMDNEQLKDIQLGDSELKLQPQELDSLSANEQIVLESTASYHKEDTNTRKCEKAFLEILISAKFALLCDFLLGIFDENITKSFLDFSLIDSKLKSGDYEQSAELFNQDVEQIWNKVQKIGEKMTTLASNLSSCHKQETGQVGVIQKNSIVPHATKQFTVGPDCSTKPDHMEASNPNCASTYNKCGTEANGGNSLPCGGCDAIYHFSSVDNSIREIPNRNWHCAACPSNDKDSDPVCTGNKKELDEVSVSKEDLAENGSGIKTATNLEETSVSSMESADPVEPSKTVNSRLCKICRTREAEDQKFLVCGHTHCPCKFYRIRCLRTNQIASAQQQNRPCWYCPSCICRGCLCDRNDDDGIVLCDWCDEAYHTFCMPKRQRYCVPCNDARARDRKRRYDEWILQQHKNEGEQSREAFWPIDLLLSAAERLSEDRSTLQR